MKKTEWFPPEVKPVHVGLYERDWSELAGSIADADWLDYWDGEFWVYASSTGVSSFRVASCQLRPWRGLTEPHNAP